MLAQETFEYASKDYSRKDRDIGNNTQIPYLLIGKIRNWDQDFWIAENYLLAFFKNYFKVWLRFEESFSHQA